MECHMRAMPTLSADDGPGFHLDMPVSELTEHSTLAIEASVISDEDITTSSHTSQGEEEVQHRCPIHLSHGGGPVQLKLEPISGSRTSLS